MQERGGMKSTLFFLLSIKTKGQTLITVAFNICKNYIAFTSTTNSIIKGFSVAM